MGYIIVRVTNKTRARPSVAWMDDETPIAGPMRVWVTDGETVEILDYQPDQPFNYPSLLPDLNLWRDHLKEQDNEQ